MNLLPKDIAKKLKSKGCWTDMITTTHALKWLREERKLHIIIPAYDINEYWWEIVNFNKNISEYYDGICYSYEEAAISAIEYCLNNIL